MHATLGNIDTYNIYGSCINGNGRKEQQLKAPLGHTYSNVRGPEACIDSIFARCERTRLIRCDKL